MATRKRVPARHTTKPASRPGAVALKPAGVRFFRTQALWRTWLERNYNRELGLWVGLYRVATGKRSINWPQSVDEALCFGWIDGLRRGLDAESYAIRFSPRSPKSLWSRVNLKRFAELEGAGLVHAAGRVARAKWDDRRTSGYSHETPRSGLGAPALAVLRRNERAWRFWEAQTPSYRQTAGHWVVSARQEATRTRRFAELVRACSEGRAIAPLKWVKVKRPML